MNKKKDTIQIFYGIPIFQLLDDKKYNEAAKKFFEYKEQENVDFNYTSSIKRFLKLGLDKFNISNRSKIKSIITEYQFIRESNEYYMRKIYENLKQEEQKEFIDMIYKIFKETTYNSFHYNAINFIKRCKIDTDVENIISRIGEIKKI